MPSRLVSKPATTLHKPSIDFQPFPSSFDPPNAFKESATRLAMAILSFQHLIVNVFRSVYCISPARAEAEVAQPEAEVADPAYLVHHV